MFDARRLGPWWTCGGRSSRPASRSLIVGGVRERKLLRLREYNLGAVANVVSTVDEVSRAVRRTCGRGFVVVCGVVFETDVGVDP